VVKLQAGGTGFAAHDGEKVQSSRHWHLGPGSGKADLRGQHQGPRSVFGLQFNN
jgi:nitric oxide synthase-interacting protein